MREISLSGEKWELKGYWPWVPLKGTSMEIGHELLGVTEWMPATVPGGVHEDLFREGLIADPYVELNSLHCEWVENRWWAYRASFPNPRLNGERIELVCKGLDYEAMVYLNGQWLGEHKGMYHPAVFDVTSLLETAETAELTIVLKQAPDEMAQIGKTSETFTQKSRFNYKWDFSTRLVNVGIWDDIVLRAHEAFSLDDVGLWTDAEDGNGLLTVSASAVRYGQASDEGLRLYVDVFDPDGAPVASWVGSIGTDRAANASLAVSNAKLWYPNGCGEQPLYEVRVRLSDAGGAVRDERTYRTGFRKLRYERNVNAPIDSLPYTIVVNDRKIYVKGANMTPLDHLYGNVPASRYEWMVRLAKNANMNLLRIWGGGLIEKPALYELCDRHGLLIWQEFIQSSSGIDNEPSKKPEFLELLTLSAETALKDRRNHVSLAVWSGGNELMSAPDTPSTYEDPNLSLLKAMVERHDPQRLFLPTSASGPVQYITKRKGVSHDVHGHWKYQDNPEHYRLYGQSDSLFHSEFGVDGVSAVKSLHKFLGERHLHPQSMQASLTWRHHGEWWDTYDRDAKLFGGFAGIADFADASQWIQAEGLRYILEANRRRKFENSGSIIWQLNEPWPNVSCTNLVDYYMETKMAYYWAGNAFRPDHVSLDYEKLDYAPGERFSQPVYAHRSGSAAVLTAEAELLDGAGTVLGRWSLSGATEPDRARKLGMLAFDAPKTDDGLFFVRLTPRVEGETAADVEPNLYVFSTRGEAVYATALGGARASLRATPLGEWRAAGEAGAWLERTYRVENVGTRAALHAYPQERTDRYWAMADRAYRTLFPGEAMTVTVTCAEAESLFGEGARLRETAANVLPDVAFYAFGDQGATESQQEQAATKEACANVPI